MLIIDH